MKEYTYCPGWLSDQAKSHTFRECFFASQSEETDSRET